MSNLDFTRGGHAAFDRQYPNGWRLGFGVALFAILALFAWGSSLAEGAPTRPLEGSFGSFSNPGAITVDQATKDVYVVDGPGTVSRFGPDGQPVNFTAGPAAGANQLSGFSFEVPFVGEAAVDAATGSSARGDIYVAGYSGLSVFSGEGEPLGTLTGAATPASSFEESCGVAVDQSTGDVYVAYYGNGIIRYTPTAGAPTEASYSGGISTTINPCQISANNGTIYASPYGSGPLRSYQSSEFTTATPPPAAAGTEFTPSSWGVATDPVNGDVYVKEASSVHVFNGTGASQYLFGTQSQIGEASAGIGVVAGGGNAYVSDRFEGANAGKVVTFGPLPSSGPPQIAGLAAANVTESGATLSANVNPQFLPTTWQFEYVDDSSFAISEFATATKAPLAPRSAGSGSSPVAVSTAIGGLEPGTAYHFRLVASNESGRTEEPEGTFTTFGAAHAPGGACSNSVYRIGPSANLPDCRAYEQVTATKGGGGVGGLPGLVQASGSGNAITFYSQAGVPGGNGAQDFPTFLASRVGESWSVQGLLPPQSTGPLARYLGAEPNLTSSFSEATQPGRGVGLFTKDTLTGTTVPIAPYGADAEPYAIVGSSADGNLVYFEDTEPVVGNTPAGQDNLYVWNRATGATTLAGVLPDGTDPGSGSFAGGYDANAGDLNSGGTFGSFYTRATNAVSSTGESVVFTTAGDGQIYQRLGAAGAGASTEHVTASQKTNGTGPNGTDPNGPTPAQFQYASQDGSSILFTSREELTNDANTGPPPNEAAAIGRSSIDGTGPEASFIPEDASALTVDAGHVYWISASGTSIGRAAIDGTAVEPEFITAVADADALAVDGAHIYWADLRAGAPGEGSIGRATLAGTAVEEEFVTGLNHPTGVAVDSNFIYWSALEPNGNGEPFGSVGRIALSGASNTAEPEFIPLAGGGGVAVSATHIYYSRYNLLGDAFIRCSFLDGSIDPNCTDVALEGTGHDRGPALAVNGSHLFWSNDATHAVGRSSLVGEEVDQDFVPTAGRTLGLSLDAGHIYWSVVPKKGINPGSDLYRFDSSTQDLTDLTPDSTQANGAEVVGVLGASSQAEVIYFVANGVLASGATQGDCVGTTSPSTCNLYVYDGDRTPTITYISKVNGSGGPEGLTNDSSDWTNVSIHQSGNVANIKSSRISPNGNTLLFSSNLTLTSYDNSTGCFVNPETETGPISCGELYRYSLDSGNLACVSCNPTGVAPTGNATLFSRRINSFSQPSGSRHRLAIVTRNMSTDGNRIFFQTTDGLVPEDTNGELGCRTRRNVGAADCQDVYEWEAAGTGSCTTALENGGCLYLLSSGQGAEPAFFADASEDGGNVFLFSSRQLVPSDGDQLMDLYDLRVNGGLVSQQQRAATGPPCIGEACQGNVAAGPPDASNGSSEIQGPGNPSKKKTKKKNNHKKSAHTCKTKKKGKRPPKCGKKTHHAKRNQGDKRGKNR
jgi:hypothetical protein